MVGDERLIFLGWLRWTTRTTLGDWIGVWLIWLGQMMSGAWTSGDVGKASSFHESGAGAGAVSHDYQPRLVDVPRWSSEFKRWGRVNQWFHSVYINDLCRFHVPNLTISRMFTVFETSRNTIPPVARSKDNKSFRSLGRPSPSKTTWWSAHLHRWFCSNWNVSDVFLKQFFFCTNGLWHDKILGVLSANWFGTRFERGSMWILWHFCQVKDVPSTNAMDLRPPRFAKRMVTSFFA